MSRKPSKATIPPSRVGSNTKLVNIEDLIHLAMGPPNINIVNFKMLEQVLYLLAQHMRVLEHQVEIQIEDLGPLKITGAGQIPGQMVPGQVPGQIPGQVVPGQTQGQVVPGQTPEQAILGQIPNHVAGQLLGQSAAGQVPGQVVPEQVSGQLVPGQVPGQLMPGQMERGQVLGQIPGQIPGQVAMQGTGQISGGRVPYQVPGQVQGQFLEQLPGASGQVAVPGQIPGQEIQRQQTQVPSQTPGLEPGGVSSQIPGQVQGQLGEQLQNQLPGQVPGQIYGQISEPADQIQIQGQPGQVLTQIPGQVAGQIAPIGVQGELIGQDTGQTPEQVPGQTPGEILRQEQLQIAEQIPGQEPGQIPEEFPGQISGPISGQISGQIAVSEQISGRTTGQVLAQTPGGLPEEVPGQKTGRRAPGSAPRPGNLPGDEIRKVTSAIDVQRRRSQIEKVRSPTYVGSVEVVTREEFDELQAQIKDLEEKTTLPPPLQLADTKELMDRLARGSASLTDTMVAVQLASRVQAAESAIGNLAGVITELAVEGGIPSDLVGILSVSESAVEIPCITREEMEEELKLIRLDMLRKMQVMIDEAVSSAQKATILIQDMNEKMEVAMDLSIRMEQLRSLVAQYTLQLESSDQGIATQMKSFQEQVQAMQDELKKAVTQLQQVNDNAETAAVMELTVHYDNLVHEMETTKAAHAALEAYQLKLDNEIRVLVEAIEQMKEEKADRDEVLDGLRDKADVSQLEGLLSEDEFQRAREALEQKLTMCYDKFRRQDNVWMNVVADFNAITENKAELVSLVSLRDQVQEELQLLHRKAHCLADMLGDPKAAIMCRQVSLEGSCAVCRVPALMEPTVPTVVPQFPPLPLPPPAQTHVPSALRPQPTGAEADAAEEPVCVTSKKLFGATDDGENLELERHICKRWVGGSHTLIGTECGRGNATRQRAEEIFTHGVVPTRRYEAYGTDGKMYKCEEGLLPCEECNQPDKESELSEKLPGKPDAEDDASAPRVTEVDPSLARRITIVDDRNLYSVKEEMQSTCECGRETDYTGESETRDWQWRQSDAGHLEKEGLVSHMGLVDAARHRAKFIVDTERSKLDIQVGTSVRGTAHVIDDETVSRMQILQDFDVILGPHRGEGEGQENDDEK